MTHHKPLVLPVRSTCSSISSLPNSSITNHDLTSSLTYTIYSPITIHFEPTMGLMLLSQDWDTALIKADKTTHLRELQKQRGQRTDYGVICVSPTPVPHLQGFLCLFRSLQVSDGNYGSSPRKILVDTFASISANVARSSWNPEGLHTMETHPA